MMLAPVLDRASALALSNAFARSGYQGDLSCEAVLWHRHLNLSFSSPLDA